MGNKLSAEHYLDLWKTWNKYVWSTPIAFFFTLSLLGATAQYLFKEAAPETRDALGLSIPDIIGIALLIVAATLFCCTMVLYRFHLCRAVVSCYLRDECEDDVSVFERLEGWEGAPGWFERMRGLDWVSWLMMSFSFFSLIAGCAYLLLAVPPKGVLALGLFIASVFCAYWITRWRKNYNARTIRRFSKPQG